jgi:predicted N-acetyltransferase YhbS
MFTVHHLRYDDPDYAAKSIPQLNLVFQVWPPNEEVDKSVIIEKARQRKCHHFTIVKGDETLAIATLFVREVFTTRGPLPVGALAGVCVHPDYRGHGWGRDVVRAAFDFLPELGVEVSLFQTGVPDFYARLGARLVFNRFHNGPNPHDPFHQVHSIGPMATST